MRANYLSLVCLILGSLLMLPYSTMAQARQLAETPLIKSNDTQLYLELRGPAERNPILLYLHGGPGNAFGILAFRSYVGPELESRFLVCYLHQRGVMNSPAVPDASLTIANHVADVQNVIHYLRGRFPGRKVYLLGHSWGGTLAVLSVLDKEGLVDGVIDVAGPLNIPANMTASYRTTLKWAEDTSNSDAIKELKALGPPPHRDFMEQIGFSRWSSSALGGIGQHLSEEGLTKLYTADQNYVMEPTLNDFELRLNPAVFCRVSRAAIVNLDYVSEVVLLVGGYGEVRLKTGPHLEVSRRRLKILMAKLGGVAEG